MTSTVKKFLSCVIILILGAIIGAGVFGVIKLTKTTENSVAETPQEENFSITTNDDTAGVKIVSTALTQENKIANSDLRKKAFTLTAMVIPEDAFNQNLDFSFSVAFVNPSSAWASGKNVSDYVSTTPQGRNSIIVTCVKPFGEQIKITATSLAIGQSAECTCDYVKSLGQYDRPNYGGRDPGYDSLDVIYYFSYTSEGTLDSIPVIEQATIYLDDNFKNAVKSHLSFDITFKALELENMQPEDITETYTGKNKMVAWFETGRDVQFSDFIENWSTLTESQKKEVYRYWYQEWLNTGTNNNRYNAYMDISINVTYNGVVYETTGDIDIPTYVSGSDAYSSYIEG